jgi:[acyl-carrier-protein] S-malonyltransferase
VVAVDGEIKVCPAVTRQQQLTCLEAGAIRRACILLVKSMSVTAFVFPGQGSQSVGMGRDLAAAFPAAREVFGEVDEALKQRLTTLMFEGPAEQLTLTENAQPALMAVSMAVVRVLELEAGIRIGRAALVAGHSLGEYSALAAAGAIELPVAARLLRLRGQAMQSAVPAGVGAMAALIGVEMPTVVEICAEAALLRREGQADARQVVQPANDNGGGQVVISGHREAVERAMDIARGRGVKRAMMLPVSAPFHCALMAPAAAAMAEALETTVVTAPLVPIVANVTAAKVVDPAEIKQLLVQQVTGTVRWRESVVGCGEMGVDRFIELGAGRVLTGLLKRIAPGAEGLAAGTPGEIEALVKVF